ncbi:MAG: stage II sporulation protein D [Clostridiales bacterium]|nr:stage II sporulation protein D [Clostridiales bacterium]
MKNLVVFVLVILAALILVPVSAVKRSDCASPADSSADNSQVISETGTFPVIVTDSENVIKVWRTSSEETEIIAEKEYIKGCVAAEMSAGCELEALKAQAAAAYTYAIYQKQVQSEDPSPELEGAYLTDSTAKHQGYLSEEERKARWGDNFEEYEEKIGDAVDAVYGSLITYNGKPIIAAFHSVSSGQTESAENVWGEDIPYLKSVSSPGDKLSPECESTVTFTPEEFRKSLAGTGGLKLDDDPAKWVGKAEKTKAGTVTVITIGGKKFTGSELRDALKLKSCCFDIKHEKNKFTVHTMGHGHLVGMSQYGADYMARQGSSWEEIVRHYYSGVEISKAKQL